LTLTTSHEIGQRWQTRGGDERRRRRMRNSDAVGQKAAKVETRSCLPVAEEKRQKRRRRTRGVSWGREATVVADERR
jgi:hypothetical protein